jgi:hypothetical protein
LEIDSSDKETWLDEKGTRAGLAGKAWLLPSGSGFSSCMNKNTVTGFVL